jgi:LacI family transcriptional regulator
MKTESRTSLREIAEKTGLSRMAVSLALRGKPGVSEATRKKVSKVAAKLGFSPDPEISKLLSRIRHRSGKGPVGCLALLTSGDNHGAWKKFPTENKYVEGAETRALEYGYRLEEFWLNDPSMPSERLAEILWNRGIEGVVVAPIQGRLAEGSRRVLDFDFKRFSCVEISETVELPELDRAIHDQYTSMQRTLRELARLGYASCGLVLERALDLRTNGKWTAAFLEHRFSSRGESGPPPLVLDSRDAKTFKRWFTRHRPEAIVSVDGFGLKLSEACGLAIPRDVAFATLDLDGEEGGAKQFAGIDQNSRFVGAAAIDVLVAAIQRGQTGVPSQPIRIEIEGAWIDGPSAPKRKRTGLHKVRRSLSIA